ncbi:MAG TPA: Do family serine endopeptidase [Pseudomonadaceae bacterium]|nr:Do family serine endopeptidase [Pseudomonadaceae bacterium]
MRIFQHRGRAVLMIAALFIADTSAILAQDAPGSRPGLADMLEEVTPAVVNIAVKGQAAVPNNPLLNDPFFRRFFNAPESQGTPQMRETQSVGSGVIIDAEKGYILSNHHVVDAATEITVILQDKRLVQASLVGSDAGTDIALLQVDADNLQALTVSDSDTLRVGDLVMAIGNPFGIGQTVTTGIVSALRVSPRMSAEAYEDFIQTDASINPGNSGGALVDYNGELIGINSAIIAPAGGNVGIGFAVPINMAMAVVDQLIEFGDVKRGMLGVSITDLTPDVVEALQLDLQQGAVVSTVAPGSAAEQAGLEAGDIIVAVNEVQITGMSHLRNTIGLLRAGTQVDISLVRDGERRTVSALIGESTEVPTVVSGAGSSALEGVDLTSIPSSHPASGRVTGVLVSNVDQSSRAFAAGLRVNDIITAVNRRPVSSAGDLQQLVQEQSGAVALNVVRDNQSMFLIVR